MSEVVLNEEVKSYPYVVAIKFDNNKKAYNFGCESDNYHEGEKVVVETVRGLELGEVVGETIEAEESNSSLALKPVIRKATKHDLQNYEDIQKEIPNLLNTCRKCIEQCQLDMNLISAEYTLDKTKAIFTYVADERVDFRDLLKVLASTFKCRIELRQIGPRDKARIIGGLGSCGMETCCSRFLNNFDVVSINMAKNQYLALNTSKLSGQCGKLMCCLKYEDDNYSELRKDLPKLNTLVYYENEKYRLTSLNVLSSTARISNKENSIDLSIEELKTLMANQQSNDDEIEEASNQ